MRARLAVAREVSGREIAHVLGAVRERDDRSAAQVLAGVRVDQTEVYERR